MDNKQNQGNSNKGESKSGENRGRNNRKRRYSSKNRSQNQNNGNGQSSSSNRRRRPNNRRPNNRNKSGPKRGPGYLNKYDQLVEQHYRARKKYFEYYHRSGTRQLDKLEKAFYRSIEQLRTFEESLKPEQREALAEKLKLYPLDHDYSVVKDIAKEGIMEVSLDFNEEPHYLESQKSRDSYADDTEESSGSLEDYEAYKKSLG